MEITYAALTLTGDREINEDYYLCRQDEKGRYFFALADGLGGHGRGDVAARLAVAEAWEVFEKNDPLTEEVFRRIYSRCHSRLQEEQASSHESRGFKTTLNLLCIEDGRALWSHIGDSRTYYFKGGILQKRTTDHSVPQMLANSGEIEEKSIRFHEDRNRLLRALGANADTVVPELEKAVALCGDERFILCSDGFWERINEEQMQLCIEESDDPKTLIDNMMELASRNRRKEKADNTTVIAIYIKGENG